MEYKVMKTLDVAAFTQEPIDRYYIIIYDPSSTSSPGRSIYYFTGKKCRLWSYIMEGALFFNDMESATNMVDKLVARNGTEDISVYSVNTDKG
jgi:hypothetical protein